MINTILSFIFSWERNSERRAKLFCTGKLGFAGKLNVV